MEKISEKCTSNGENSIDFDANAFSVHYFNGFTEFFALFLTKNTYKLVNM